MTAESDIPLLPRFASNLNYFRSKSPKDNYRINNAKMLERLKMVKKQQAENRAEAEVQSPVLTEEDENFLERIVSAGGPPPALPERPVSRPPELPERPTVPNCEAGDSTNNDEQMVVYNEAGAKAEAKAEEKAQRPKGKGKENVKDKGKKKSHRFSFLRRSKKSDDGLKPTTDVPKKEAEKEEDDISRVLDELNLAAVNNRAFSISKESQKLVQEFTVILKDLVNGVPTAYDDLVKLIENSSDTLSKNYEQLPSFLKKLVASLPQKFTSSLAPELLAVATEAQAFASPKGGLASKAKGFLNLKDLVAKPGAVAGMLKAIMNALKMRWPAFMGTNVLLSLGLFGESIYFKLTTL
jgi:hypothetical protein